MGEAAVDEDYADRFAAQISDDLNMPRALAVAWELARSELPASTQKATLLLFDRVLGLGLAEWAPKEDVISEEIIDLVQKRQQARLEKHWKEADELRAKIRAEGYEVEDTPQGPRVKTAI
jgi:cysteinyl-tRNA synthetase